MRTTDQWRALRDVLGRPSWANDPRLDSLAARHAAHDRIDEEIRYWCADRDLAATVDLLIAAGVPAATVFDPRETSRHPQMIARGFFEEPPHPVVGTHPIPTVPFRFAGVEKWVRTPAPTMGEHDSEILRSILCLDEATIDDLTAQGVIGDQPTGL